MRLDLTLPRPTLASVRVEHRCESCGYGALLPPRSGTPCPMCRKTTWTTGPSR